MSEKPRPNLALRILYGIEDGLLVAVLSAMILLSFSQIIMRNFFSVGFVWGDPFLRYMVLWVGLLGAMVATREYNHINIDLVSHFFPPRAKAAVRVVTDAFTMTVCGFLTYASVMFLIDEKAMETMAFGKVPTWIAELILPVAFGVIALRYAIYMTMHLIESIKGVSPEPEEEE